MSLLIKNLGTSYDKCMPRMRKHAFGAGLPAHIQTFRPKRDQKRIWALVMTNVCQECESMRLVQGCQLTSRLLGQKETKFDRSPKRDN